MTKLDDKEIAGFATLLGGAGAETVTKLVANAFVLFARHPDQYRRLIDDRGSIPAAVEEILRIWPPSQYQGRFSLQDAEFHGVTLPAGHPVLLITGSATRDERFFDDPDALDIGSAAQPVTRLRARHPQLPGRRWRAWRAASPSRRCPALATLRDRRGRPAPACTCPTSPASPACRSVSASASPR